MQSFSTTVTIMAPREKVYKALTTQEGLAAWWTPDCETENKMGGKAVFHFGKYYVAMQIEKLVEERHIVWRCVDQYFKFENVASTNDWLGTIVEFQLEKNDDQSTSLHFTHEGLTSELASYEQTKALWSYLLLMCLKVYLENMYGHRL